MARRSPALRLPSPPPPDDAAATAEAVAEAVARELAANAPRIEELRGTTALLDHLDALGTTERARYGFRFRVVLAEGARAFLPDSDWGETVPTPAAIADRYGPGSYVVQVGERRNGRGGGWGPEIPVRIAPPRTPDRPAIASSGPDHRMLDLLERVLLSREERAAEDAGARRAPTVTRDDLDDLEARLRAAVSSGDQGGLAKLLEHPLAAELMRTMFAPAGPAPAPAAADGEAAS